MKISLHCGRLGYRGTDRALKSYSRALNKLGYDSQILVPDNVEHCLEGCADLRVTPYGNLREATGDQRLFYILEHGLPAERDVAIPVINHAVFDATTPFGHRYAAISQWLARRDRCPNWVPHIVESIADYNTPDHIKQFVKNKTVIGWLGGHGSFDRPSAINALTKCLCSRDDIVFLAKGISPFLDHDKAIFVAPEDTSVTAGHIVAVSHSFLHARIVGESFGLAIAEFAIEGRHIMVCDGTRDKAHLDHLGDDPGAFHYVSQDHLFKHLMSLTPDTRGADPSRWDQFKEDTVMQKFQSVFLNGF